MSTEQLQLDGEEAENAPGFESVNHASPAAKLVYKVLEYAEGGMEVPEIAEETRLSERTVEYRVSQLETADLIDKRPSLRDPRARVYSVPEEGEP